MLLVLQWKHLVANLMVFEELNTMGGKEPSQKVL
jgi:hypothetical protein